MVDALETFFVHHDVPLINSTLRNALNEMLVFILVIRQASNNLSRIQQLKWQ